MFNYGWGYTRNGAGGNKTGINNGGGPFYGRVVDIILDSSHEMYNDYGKSQAINGVFYRPLGVAESEQEYYVLKFAYQSSAHVKALPLKNEIVQLEFRSSEQRELEPDAIKTYWTTVVPVWNHPHHNAWPDTKQFPEQENNPDFGDYFEEQAGINPLQSFPGDLMFESRYGQSIRMSGTRFDSNPWIDSTNNGKPIFIIRNGQGVQASDSTTSIVEDIDKDKSSIYLTSDHKVELTEANSKRDAWNNKPRKIDKYKGSQILLNSDRLVLNARKENILISANDAIGLNAQTVNIDGIDHVSFDANKIYLGAVARRREHEPLLLGQTSVNWLEDYIGKFEQLLNTMSKLPPAPPAAIGTLIAIANALLPVVKVLKSQLPTLQSQTSYTQ